MKIKKEEVGTFLAHREALPNHAIYTLPQKWEEKLSFIALLLFEQDGTMTRFSRGDMYQEWRPADLSYHLLRKDVLAVEIDLIDHEEISIRATRFQENEWKLFYYLQFQREEWTWVREKQEKITVLGGDAKELEPAWKNIFKELLPVIQEICR